MKDQKIAQILDEIAADEVPRTLDLWPGIRTRIRPGHRRSWRVQLVPATRLGWAVLAAALFLALSAGAYAVAPVVGKLFEQEVGLQTVELADLVQEFALSQTVDGVTVTLERAYADSNRIVIGFTIRSPGDRRYEARRLMLTDADGTHFPWRSGFGAAGQSDIYRVSLPPGEGAYLLTFDAAALVGSSDRLSLRLAMELEELPLPSDAPAELSVPAEEGLLRLHAAPDPPPLTPAGPSQPGVVELQPMAAGAFVGPFIFDFSVPLIPGRTLDVQHTVKAAGVPVTLERVVVTPSETQAIFCFHSPDVSKEWLLILADGGQDPFGRIAGELGESGQECHRVTHPGALASRSGLAKLEVTELAGFELSGAGEGTRLAGPWVFHFRAP